jgi:hypothetical protein
MRQHVLPHRRGDGERCGSTYGSGSMALHPGLKPATARTGGHELWVREPPGALDRIPSPCCGRCVVMASPPSCPRRSPRVMSVVWLAALLVPLLSAAVFLLHRLPRSACCVLVLRCRVVSIRSNGGTLRVRAASPASLWVSYFASASWFIGGFGGCLGQSPIVYTPR